ncbi:MAG TPA: DNA primase [Clostridia bacterium]|nr:DNA primase [Clostridia bacterium]
MAISDAFIEELRSKTEIENIVSPYVNLKRHGSVLTGLCPFHNEKTPSFTVYPENKSFYCFGCGVGGDIITFVRKIENLDYVEAIKSLAQNAGMQMPEDGFDDSLIKKRARIFSANRSAAKFFNSMLFSPEGKSTLDYLINRGFSIKTIKNFGLGYAPDSWDRLLGHMQKNGFSAQELFEANLVSKSSKSKNEHFFDRFRNRMMIPIIDLRGNVVAFGGRALDENSKAKYINTSDTLVYKKGRDIFALCFAKKGNVGSLILTEGYMDVIALHQAGFTNAVASLGTALTRDQAKLLSRYAKELIICYDNDEAGQKATNKALAVLGHTDLKLKVLNLKDGKDPDEIIKKFGKERFKGILDGAANDIEFKLLNEREKHDISTSNGKLDFLSAAANILAEIHGSIERDIYASKLAYELEVSKDAIVSQIENNRKKLISYKKKNRIKNMQRESVGANDKLNPQKVKNIRAAKAEEAIISSLLNNIDLYGKVSDKINADDFITDINRHVYKVISQRIEEGRSVDIDFLSAKLNNEEMSIVMRLKYHNIQISNTIEECYDCIKVILEEKNRQKDLNPASLSDEEYLKLFRQNNT